MSIFDESGDDKTRKARELAFTTEVVLAIQGDPARESN
jgi:hypothetical protein